MGTTARPSSAPVTARPARVRRPENNARADRYAAAASEGPSISTPASAAGCTGTRRSRSSDVPAGASLAASAIAARTARSATRPRTSPPASTV
jgi:hypothetical protein